MPIANVSDIVGRRDLVKESQGWADLWLKKKELKMKQEKADEVSKPKPYNFELAEFGTNNEAMLGLQENLNDQVYNYAMANTDLLSIDPRSEDCGPDCKRSHRTLHNMQSAAKIFNTYGNDLKSRHDALAQLMVQDEDNYDNAENQQRLEDMKNIWKQGMGGENYNFTFGPDGRLVVNSRKRKRSQKIKTDANGPVLNANGKEILLYDDGSKDGTDDPTKAKKDNNGDPIPLMVDINTGQDTDFDSSQMGFGNWLTDLGFSDKVSNANISNFSKTNAEYSTMVFSDDEGNYNDTTENQSYKSLEAYIFGSAGSWDDRTGTGKTNGHSYYLKELVRQEKAAAEDITPITKDDLIKMAYKLGMGYKTGETTSKKEPVDETELVPYNISGKNYKHDIVFLGDNKNIDTKQTHEDYKISHDVNYSFEGQDIDTTGSEGKFEFALQFKPSNLTLFNGDNRFMQANADNLLGYNETVHFEARAYGVQLFGPNGRAISSEAYDNLDLEKQKECNYLNAIVGRVRVPANMVGDLNALGIKWYPSSDKKFIYIDSIVPAARYNNRIKGIGSSKSGAKTYNLKAFESAEKQRKILQDDMEKRWETGDGSLKNKKSSVL